MTSKYQTLVAKQIAIAGVALLASTFCVMPADAAPNNFPSITVKYADLDLSTTIGAHRLYNRIVAAAEKVCPNTTALDLQVLSIARACKADAIARAVSAVNSPQLAALYEQHNQHG